MKIFVCATSASHFPQENAHNNLQKCAEFISKKISSDLIVIDDPITEKTELTQINLSNKEVDLLILIQGAFTWDDIAVNIINRFRKNIPIVIWSLPEPDFISGVLETNSLCGALMNNAAFHKIGIPNFFIYGDPSDKKVQAKLNRIIKAIYTVLCIKNSRYGMIGYRPTGFYSSTFDEMEIRKRFGIETRYLDLSMVFDQIESISISKIKDDTYIASKLGTINEASEKSILDSSKVYCSLLQYIKDERIDFFGIRCWPEMMKKSINPCMVLGRLTEDGICAACESDFAGALSMKIAYLITNTAPWLADLIHINEVDRSLYFWHCGAASASLADPDISPVLNKQFRGLDRGTTLEFNLKNGVVTILRVGITDNNYRIFAFTGEIVKNDIQIRGNIAKILIDQLPSEMIENMAELGIEHHFAIVYGDIIETLKYISKLWKIKFFSG